MNNQQCREQLTALLEEHNQRITSASEYLAGIRQAIAENQLESLQDSLAKPEFVVDDIEQLEQQRYQLLSNYGFSQDADGFEKCMAWCDDGNQQVSALYQQLIQNLVRLQHSTQVNSLLVNRGRDRVRRSLGILTGLGTTGTCKTYSSDGKLGSSDPRDIAIA
ncbi:MAG: flagellar protein FlgN [Gammaproteobacteria bacterium]|nr:flagellar protein FlgN [Gammaproteobacteria bacterium]MDH3857909.1 flagellar protein FlgN [Gammaproteobacteria bacterium]